MCLEGPQMPGTAFVEAIKPTPGLAIRPAECDAGQAPQSAMHLTYNLPLLRTPYFLLLLPAP